MLEQGIWESHKSRGWSMVDLAKHPVFLRSIFRVWSIFQNGTRMAYRHLLSYIYLCSLRIIGLNKDLYPKLRACCIATRPGYLDFGQPQNPDTMGFRCELDGVAGAKILLGPQVPDLYILTQVDLLVKGNVIGIENSNGPIAVFQFPLINHRFSAGVLAELCGEVAQGILV